MASPTPQKKRWTKPILRKFEQGSDEERRALLALLERFIQPTPDPIEAAQKAGGQRS